MGIDSSSASLSEDMNVRLESISAAEPLWDNVEPLCRDGITEPWQEEVTEVKKTLGGSGEGVPGCVRPVGLVRRGHHLFLGGDSR